MKERNGAVNIENIYMLVILIFSEIERGSSLLASMIFNSSEPLTSFSFQHSFKAWHLSIVVIKQFILAFQERSMPIFNNLK